MIKPIPLGFWLAVAFICGSALANDEIRWAPDVAAARNAAAQYKVPLLIHFYGDNCLPCTMLEQRVFNKPELVETLNKYFICVRVNASQNRQVAIDYQVHSWPTDVFVSHDGKTLYQGICPQDLAGYLNTLQNVAVINRDRNVLLSAERPTIVAPTQAAFQPAAQPTSQPANVAAQSTSHTNGQTLQPFGATAPVNNQVPAQTNMNLDVSRGPLASSQLVNRQGPQLTNPQPGSIAPPAQPSSPSWQGAAGPNFNHTGKLPPQNAGMQTAMQQMPMIGRASEQPVAGPKFGLASSQSSGVEPSNGQLINNPYAETQQIAAQQPAAQQPAWMSGQNTNSVRTAPTDGPLLGQASTPPVDQIEFQPKAAMNSQNATANPAAEAKPALEGYCPVALTTSGTWVMGSEAHAVKHRGRIYWLSNENAVAQFLQAPDATSPVFSGYDPYVFLNEGKIVEGDIRFGLHEQVSGNYLLFATAEAKQAYWANFDRYTQALNAVLKKAAGQ